jgi:hypothetical protein
MQDTMVDVESIIKNNANVSVESLRRVESLIVRMRKLGIEKTSYRLASPFSVSLRKMHKASPKRQSRKSK